MGYTSAIKNFKKEDFSVIPGTVELDFRRLMGDGAYEDLTFWFEFEIDEDGDLYLVPSGEVGKAYELKNTLESFLEATIRSRGDVNGTGLVFSLERWGEGSGDAELLISDGRSLRTIAGVTTFPGDPR